ncbi:MAG: heat-inducible transcriptional repressor HrcA [Candidatus Omnitrophota bacterium]
MVVTDAISRRNKILETVIDSYVSTATPVGSFTVSKKYRIGLSPATIRNVMVELEKLGYIAHPHTSAGRVPTDKGYRYYVDTLMELKHLTEEEREFIEKNLTQDLDELEDIIRRTARAISTLTKQTSLISFPRAKKRTFKRLELISTSAAKIHALLFTAQGVVKHSIFELQENIEERELSRISKFLNEELLGLPLSEIKDHLLGKILSENDPFHHLFKQAIDILNLSRLLEEKNEKILLDGTHHIIEQPEFRNTEKIKAILKALEDEDEILDILDEDLEENVVKIHIGSENPYEDIRECSIVVSNYKIGEENIGGIGLIGPTRMDYSKVVSVIEYVGQIFSRSLARLGE